MSDVFFVEGKGLRKMGSEGEGWVKLTDADKYNHCKPFIEYIGKVIQKHSITKLQGDLPSGSTPDPESLMGNKDSRKYLFYLSIGGNPESPDGVFQLFPNLFIEDENTKVYYVGVDIFNKVTKVIDYKQFEGEDINKDKKDIIEVKLFSMFWIDDCKHLIDSVSSLVKFNSTNSNCLGTICVNFAKFRSVRSPVFENLNNIFPIYNSNSLKFLKEIETTKSVYMHSLGYYKIESKYLKKMASNWIVVDEQDPVGIEKLVLSKTNDLSNQVSIFDLEINMQKWMLENVKSGANVSYLPKSSIELEQFYGITDIKDIIQGENEKFFNNKFFYAQIWSHGKEDGFGLDIYEMFTVYGMGGDGEDSLFNGEFIDIKEAPESIVPAGKLNDVEEQVRKEGESKTLAGGYIFDKIINPVTGRKVKTNSKLGIKILKKYIKNIKT